MKISSCIAFAAAIFAVTAAQAQAQDVTLRDVLTDSKAAAAFQKMFGKVAKPAWLAARSTESPAVSAALAGREVSVLTACKAHSCSDSQVAILYDKSRSVMYGLILETGDDHRTEKLTWLNIGGGEESIDGKTILYAALTGSLENHPGAFNFK